MSQDADKQLYLIAAVETDRFPEELRWAGYVRGRDDAKERLYELMRKHSGDARAQQEAETGFHHIDRWFGNEPIRLCGWLTRYDCFPVNGEGLPEAEWEAARDRYNHRVEFDRIKSDLVRRGWPKGHQHLDAMARNVKNLTSMYYADAQHNRARWVGLEAEAYAEKAFAEHPEHFKKRWPDRWTWVISAYERGFSAEDFKDFDYEGVQ